MKRIIPQTICLLSMLLTLQTAGAKPRSDSVNACPMVKIEAKQMPDLNIARAGHVLFYANDELTVAGGHTDGFVPSPTAEYLKEGEWHPLQMVYNHDNALAIVLRNGKVLLAGGSSEPIGIGQTFLSELYDPKSHTFDGFNSMQHKRTLASALELDSGQVVIAGNWYHQDGIEIFDSRLRRFHYLRNVNTSRATPIILQTAPDDALIFGNNSYRGDTLHTAYAYQLKGDSIHIPLFDTWHPLHTCRNVSAIGKQGDYTYLFPVYNQEGQVAIATYQKGDFSLLSTSIPIPMKALNHVIEYNFNILVDQQSQRAYLFGCNQDFHKSPNNPIQYYILAIDYAQALKGKPAPLTLYYTQPITGAIDAPPLLTPEGDIVMAGGFLNGSNFTPSKSVWLIPFGTYEEKAETAKIPWAWLIPLVLLFVGRFFFLFIFREKESKQPAANQDSGCNTLLIERIRELIENKKLFLNSELKITDIADTLGIHRNIVSDAINSQTGFSFNQYISNYRIEHAKSLLRQDPNKKLSSISAESGFANEQSFFRTFKAITGKTPKEWILSINTK
ncbi:MAG: helix-turn-helix domain-containing protein [Prevotella sp.]|nr:helix-turn-helix domain-containing protein [Prevotella sp.]